ncbi:PAS domain S-box protein, partial [Pantanalinema sp. GBBB05]|uniref:PAS domain S-box protein n=1 Tax=Pantanalinema sp. GBBB05 TaxID=2604139 RepID=UPI001DC590C0|nr:PAS domain S-box protein [Pantanalinema sp. GBBB05]
MLDRSVFCSATTSEQILDTLSEMAQQIHQGTGVDAILSMVVNQCRTQLQADRVIIEQLMPQTMAVVQAESVGVECVPMLGNPMANAVMTAKWIERYQQHPWIEISQINACDPSYQAVLARFQVQAVLIVPILVQGHLWGLLSVHHCRSERIWQRLEGQFLQQIALHLGVRLQTIAERQTAETSRRQYEQIVSATPDCVALIDRDYIYQAINQTYVRWNNKAADEILGQSVSQLLGETVFQMIRSQIDRALTGETTSWQGWITYAGEGLKFVWATYTPYVELDNTVSGVVINVHDLTELKRVQETLAQSEERFRQMADNIHEVFWMTDLDGTQLLYVSPAYEDVWGQSCTSLYERPQR